MQNWGKKKQAQKSSKNQKMAKSKKWYWIKKVKASKAKNLSIQSKLFLTSRARKEFIILRQAFVEAPIINYFDLKRHIQIET